MLKYVIIAAGGIGTRMHSNIPKQFIIINDKPIIIHTIEKFIQTKLPIEQFIIACPIQYHNHTQKIITQFLPHIKFVLTKGGENRFDSIKVALSQIKGIKGMVAVHDAARPCTSSNLIVRCFDAASSNGNCVPYAHIKESIRQKSTDTWVVANREQFVTIQTPQVFKLPELTAAYAQPYNHSFTDDATVIEQYGIQLHFIQGEDRNIKITTPDDLILANALL